ncbi:MAG: DNA polymerase III subunit [Clostridia bacterium]|nr:DNA polymerase III subunit [Clostridia bacterium]
MYGFRNIYHDKLMRGLISSLQNGSHQHAYIFEGVEGLGKHNCAALFAAALTCMNQHSAPCGSCPSCIQSKSGSNPDIIFVSSGDKKSIGTDRIREISTDAYIKPFETARKVYIIEDGELLTEQAQNAFLKVLEEPPEYVVFIIVASSASFLLQTVLSRCVLIRFSPLSEDKIRRYIQSVYPSETSRIDFLAKYACGIPGNVDKVIANEAFEPLRQNAFSSLKLLFSPRKLSAYDIADFLEENKENAELILDLWLEFVRDMLFIQCGEEKLLINLDMKDNLQKEAAKLNEQAAVKALEFLFKAKQMLSRYVNLRALSLNLAFCIKNIL